MDSGVDCSKPCVPAYKNKMWDGFFGSRVSLLGFVQSTRIRGSTSNFDSNSEILISFEEKYKTVSSAYK